MSTSWVAGSVRAKALAGRRLGAGGARALAGTPSLAEAVETLSRTPYGRDVHPGQTLGEVEHAVGASLLWHLRVLAGWLPRGGADLLRLLAAGFEVANVDEHLARLRGEAAEPAYVLGSLDTAWSRLSSATSLADVGDVLGTSPWRVRGGGTRREVHLGLRLAWADAVVAGVPEAADWARSGAALLVVREVVLEGRRLPEGLRQRATAVLGPAFVATVSVPAVDLAALADALPGRPGRLFDDVRRPEDVWSAEALWWRRTEQDGFALLRSSGYDRRPVVGAVAVLAADAWRVRAALETAARGGAGSVLEAFDGVA